MKEEGKKKTRNGEDVFFDKVYTGGRPRKVLNTEGIAMVENLARIFCTHQEIADCLHTERMTLTNESNDEIFRQAYERGRSQGKMSLRRKQFEVAMKGNHSMLIWLGKQYLEQTEKVVAKVEDNEGKKALIEYMELVAKGRVEH